MDVLDRLDPAVRRALVEWVGRLKHDLGKYVAFQIRFLPDDASLAERAAALEQDLLNTRRGPTATLDAPTVWGEFRGALVGEDDLPGGTRTDLRGVREFDALDEAMGRVTAWISGARTPDEATVATGTAAALDASNACRALHQRLRGA